MEVSDVLNRRNNRWPRTDFGGPEGKLATLAQYRLAKVLDGQNVVWADGASTEDADGNITVHATVATEDFLVLDAATSEGRNVTSYQGKTRVVPWSAVSEVTVREYWPQSDNRSEAARFTVHMGAGPDIVVDPAGTSEGRATDVAFLELALRKLVENN